MPSPSLSPRVQQFSAPAPSNDQAKTLFEQGLSQMAYNVLLSKLPNVAPDVVTSSQRGWSSRGEPRAGGPFVGD